MTAETERRTFSEVPADTATSEYSMYPPGPLTAIVQIGLIVTEHHFTAGPLLEAINKILLRLETTLSVTPHTYQFILPHQAGPEHIILEALLADSIWESIPHPDIVLIRCGEGKPDEGHCPFEGDIDHVIQTVHEEDATPGYNPVHDAIVEDCTLVLLIGEWEPGVALYRPGSVFDLARNKGRTIIAVNPVNGRQYERAHDDMIFDSYSQLNQYNKEDVKNSHYTATYRRYLTTLRDEAEKAQLDDNILEPIYGSLLPYFTRTRLLVKKYQRLHKWTGTAVTLLAALAVATITFQTLFLPEMPWLVWVEVFEISLIILLMYATRHGDFHRRWIDYNFLAERLRAAFFLCIICIQCEKPDAPPHMSLAHRPNDWMVMAFEDIMESRPIHYCRLDIPYVPIKKFFRSAWITNRLAFYEQAGASARRTYALLTRAGVAIFFITLILAVIHATGIGHWETEYPFRVPMLLAFFTITLPAAGSAIAALRLQREYQRNAERYAHTVRHLTAIRNQVQHAKDMKDLCEFLEEMNEVTLREQQDWRIIFRFRQVEAM
ncbi:hypothetical protein [Methanogenium organophilum]|uniref:SMODS and SLOG-associating 2TM effector domain-containing protein n=1 Tax=Methanogenium organophilum TaxID=2199 RepID=A0A9X9S2P3_METOG|nr:hypothetical protein [Methanogenium organophilum]WAI00426.1 hypothetical protein OU421_08275 [Methanogenium organophilum]